MSEWKTLRVGQLAQFHRGVTWSKDQETRNAEPDCVPVLRIPNIQTKLDTSDLLWLKGVSKPTIKQCAAAKDWTLMVGSNGNPERVGNCVFIDTENEFLFASFLVGVEPVRPDAVSPEFLFRILGSPSVQRSISRSVQGSTGLTNINLDRLRVLTVNCPSLSEQSGILAVLSTLDEAIEQTEALIAKTKQVKAGLLHDLFTRGVTADGRLRPSRENAPQFYKQTPLGWIPREWEVLPTSDHLEVVDPQPDHRTPPQVEDGYPYIGTGDIDSVGEIDFAGARKISYASFAKQRESFSIYPGAFLFGKIGTIGHPVRIPHERCFAISANVVLLTSQSIEQISYAYWYYQSIHIERQTVEATNKTSQPALGIQQIRQFLIAWPKSERERLAVSSRLASISDWLRLEVAHRHKLLLIKSALMHDLLTGRVRVPVSKEEP